jgi:selenocysteine lyase/cysteine desulfurase
VTGERRGNVLSQGAHSRTTSRSFVFPAPRRLYARPVRIDVERARLETPGCATVVHLNNAGAALPPAPVTDAVVAHLRREAEIGGYEAAAEAAPAVADTYRAIARLCGCDPSEIALLSSATRAWNAAFTALTDRMRPGERILTGHAEYASNVIAFLHVARRRGLRVEVVDDDEHGQTSLDDLARRLGGGGVGLVAVTHVPTQGGLVNPAAAIGRLTRAAGVPYLLDACQSAGQMPLDVEEIGCDALSATGRKFLRGPRGTGFLYVRSGLVDGLDAPFPDLGSARMTSAASYEIAPGARRFEEWERSFANVIGLGVAVGYALSRGLDPIRDRVVALAAGLRERLSATAGVTVHDRGQVLCGIVTFTVAGVSSAEVVAALRERRINTSVSLAEQGPYDLAARQLADVVRASVHYYNTEDELDGLCVALPAPA